MVNGKNKKFSMVINIKVNLLMITNMDMEYLSGKLGMYISAILSVIKGTEWG